jgi:hypothetical protein
MATKVKIDNFSGSGRIFERTSLGLAPILRGMLIDNARLALKAASLSALTDSSAGTVVLGAPLGGNALIAPSGVFNAVAANGVGYAALNTSLGKFRNAQAVWAAALNVARAVVGLPYVTSVEGTVASSYTVPAQDLSNTGEEGVAAVNYSSYLASLGVAVSNQQILAVALNEVLTAVGAQNISLAGMGEYSVGRILTAIPAVVADSTGALSVALADGTALMAALADNWATMAFQWNFAFKYGTAEALTDSTGGTATPAALAVVTAAALTGFEDAGTASLGGTAFNAQLALYQNAFSSIQAAVNHYAISQGLAPIADASGGTVSLTLAAESIAPVAVAGGATAASLVSVDAALVVVTNNLSTLAAQLNALAGDYDVAPIVDSSGGVSGAGLVAIPATVDANNSAAAVGVANTAAITIMTAIRSNISTLAATANALLNNVQAGVGLHVVAG